MGWAIAGLVAYCVVGLTCRMRSVRLCRQWAEKRISLGAPQKIQSVCERALRSWDTLDWNFIAVACIIPAAMLVSRHFACPVVFIEVG